MLVLDEPTNDLDIDTLELLEELLQDYPGTVLLVSHDRTFLDNVVTQVIAFEGDGVLREYAGGYDDWLAQRARPVVEKAAAKPVTASKAEAPKPAAKSKLSWKDAQELAALPEQIRALEEEQAGITARLSDGTLYVTQANEAKRLQARMAEIEVALETLLARWEALEAKQAAV